MVDRLKWHRGQGHTVVIVSASYEDYLCPVAEHLEVDAVLATRLEVGSDGVLTGGLLGRNCRADEKVHRLHAWMRDAGINPNDATVWAYGDSAGDRELLAAADHAVWAGDPLATVAPTD